MTATSLLESKSFRFLKIAINIWFTVVVVGQFIFALYILGLYGVSGITGDFERWSKASLHGYTQGAFISNLFFGIHVLLAAITTIFGPLQLIKKMRNMFPKFHKISGRIYIYSAFTISIAGLYLFWTRGIIGGFTGGLFININSILILGTAFITIRKAIAGQFEAHRKWALRLFLAMSGVWFFRVFLMLWLTINMGPLGFDMDTFEGPALTMLYVFSYILPILFLEFYFLAKKNPKSKIYWATAIFLLLLTCAISVGTFSATVGLWIPSL